MILRTVCALALVVATVAAAPQPGAKPTMRQVLQATFAVHDLGDVDLSPSGDAVAWHEGFRSGGSLTESRRHAALYIQRLDAASPTRLTASKPGVYDDEENPVWSPDGTRIAFLSDARSKGQLQLFVAQRDGSGVHQLGTLKGDVQSLSWSPDGSALAVLYIQNAQRQSGALAPGARDVGVIGENVEEQRLARIDAGSGAVTLLTPADDYVYEYGWSPDGARIALTYARGNGDNNWWVAKLATIDARSPGAMHDLLAPAFQINAPRWSPDGKQIAFIGGVMSDFGSVGGDLYAVDAAGGAPRDLTPGARFSVQSLRWIDPARIDMVVHVPGALHLVQLDTASGAVKTLTDANESIGSWSATRNGDRVAMVRQSFDTAPEVWAGAPGALQQLSKSNIATTRLWGTAKSISWKSDGYDVQGWLIYPLVYDPEQHYPMVTIVHGGPSAQSLPSYGNRNIAALSSQGYFVFEPNPRGSFGQGEAFTRANIKDFGYGDWRDDLAGVDAALATAPIDPARLGLFGWSYGGYMAMWAETQTTRFKAIVGGAGIVSWQSYYGQNKIDQWMIPFFGASVYDDPAVYAKSSPITFIKQSKTPILILQGERDEEVPAPQAFEFYHAMTTLGVPSKLIVYADEGHGPQKPANQIDILTRTLAWFNTYLL
jgi:dipeptidyl aminopeptidase/acylaminoacyl peptidase